MTETMFFNMSHLKLVKGEPPYLTIEEGEEQFEIATNYTAPGRNDCSDPTRFPKLGSVRKDSEDVLQYYWTPRGGNYTEEEAGSLHGWYKVPNLSQIEAWIFDSTADTPNGDAVEPDHPDSWLHLLGAC
tara:strand:- start:325 stop:711 length:387 start_codon:yes stop_codon:yes gene_type:complete